MTGRVLITGGLGYLGGRIAQVLADNGYRVILGSRQTHTAAPTWLPRAEIARLDLSSSSSLVPVCTGVDAIVHLAALNEIDSAARPGEAIQVNTVGTLNLLQAAEQAGVKRFIFFSTAHIYGSPLAGVITERTLPRPTHPYAITHRATEDFVIAAHDRKTLTGIVVRLSNGFGAPAHAHVNRWTLLVNDLCRQAVTERSLTLKSSGLQRRDFIPLSDITRAVDHLLKLPASQCGDGIFNLGGEMSLRIIDVAERVAGRCALVLGFSPPVIRPELAPSDVSVDLDYRIDKLKSTGFRLISNIDQEIDTTLAFCMREFRTKS
jgi:UDP-glucose 4-epimerase